VVKWPVCWSVVSPNRFGDISYNVVKWPVYWSVVSPNRFGGISYNVVKWPVYWSVVSPNRSVFSCNSDGSRSSLMMADYCRNM
jgi:hypothetical protein